MTSDDLDAKQTKAMADALFRHVNYLLRLKRRMSEKQFPRDDKLLLLTEAAYDAVQRLYLDVLGRNAVGNFRVKESTSDEQSP